MGFFWDQFYDRMWVAPKLTRRQKFKLRIWNCLEPHISGRLRRVLGMKLTWDLPRGKWIPCQTSINEKDGL